MKKTTSHNQLHCIVHSFYHERLGIKQLPLIIFSFIYGLWRKDRRPVFASYSTIQKLTGSSRPYIAKSLRQLEDKGYIKATPDVGKRSYYTIGISSDIVDEFERLIKRERQEANVANSPTPSRQSTEPHMSETVRRLPARPRNPISIGEIIARR